MKRKEVDFLHASELLSGMKVSVKLQFENPNSLRLSMNPKEKEDNNKLFTYTYSEHGICLATKDEYGEEAGIELITHSNDVIKDAWSSLTKIESNNIMNKFIKLKPELRTMRYNTLRNGYVKTDYGYSLLYAKGKDIEKMKDVFVGDHLIITLTGAEYNVLNKISILKNGDLEVPNKSLDTNDYVKPEYEGIIFELEQIHHDQDTK